MVQELNRPQASQAFPDNAPTAYPVFYRTYSRRTPQGDRETWPQVCARSLAGLVKLGKLTDPEADLIRRMQDKLWALPSGRWLWVGGTPWLENSANFSGAYNCTSTNVTDWRAFGLMMDLAMMGCGTGAVLEPKYIEQLPAIRNPLTVEARGVQGEVPAGQRQENTTVAIAGDRVEIIVGDSRQGWVYSYQTLLELSSDERFGGRPVHVTVDVSNIRPTGEPLKGFGGVANPVKVPEMYHKLTKVLNGAVGRKLTSVECCLLIDEAAVVVVAGNVRRCLPEDALVHTDRGLVPIQQVQVGDRVQTPLGFRRVVDKFDQGIQDVYDVETNATAPRATLNHRMAVLTDAKGGLTWKRIGDLQPGDRLLHSTQILPGSVTTLPQDFTDQRPPQSRTAKPLTIPSLSADVAWLIGFTHGDGNVTVGRNKHDKPYGYVMWATNARQPELAQRLQDKLDRALALFGQTVRHSKVRGENTLRSICCSIRLAEYFHRHIKQPQQSITIPPFILQGSAEVRAAYLAGVMDSDGAAHNRPPHLVTTVYPNFARQVAAVLSSLGLAGRMSLTRPEVSHWRVKYNVLLPAFKREYNALIAPHSVKGALREGLKSHGFTLPGEMMRETYTYSEMRGMGFEGSRQVASNYERYRAESEVNLDIPVTVKGLGSYDSVQTYDIEVEEAHCFYCDGYLTHNSAGMRQGTSEDAAFAMAKENLWQQDDQGNWRIDPDRDSLRMANHTRVFHHKPTEEECVAAVRKQFYSGEGAIQWAGEAIARSNADIVPPERKAEFIAAYGAGQGREWLKAADPSQGDRELDHRLGRYGLNPCVTADTWVHTEFGPRQVRDLIGRQHGTYVNGELFSTTEDGFFQTGVQPVLKVTTREGVSLRLTGNHRLLKVTSQTQKRQYTEWTATEALQPGDRLCLHNHRDITPWQGEGTFAEGWLLGSLVGDGSLAQTAWRDQGILRFWGETQTEMAAHAIATLRETVVHSENLTGHYHPQHNLHQVSSSGLGALAAQFGIHRGQKWVSPEVEQSSYDFHRGFLQGLFDADGSVQGHHGKGISVRLAQSSLATLEAVQRMLLRLGIAARIYKNRRPAGMRLLPNADRTPAPYFCQAQHELVLANDNLLVFRDRVGFQQPDKRAKLNDLLDGYRRKLNRDRFTVTVQAIEPDGIEPVYDCTVPGPARFDANGLVAHNCGEILGEDFHCNLGEIHLNQINPTDRTAQRDAFTAGGLAVASLLNHRFEEERYRFSREVDPIVGVSFTGLFDFFVQAFGVEWLKWWEAGRPETPEGLGFKAQERDYLTFWRDTVHETVWEYCDRHGLRRPNRCTTVQPSGTKSLLTGASPGWHPPKAARFIRRITFRKNDPVALACMDYGYSIVPSQSDKDGAGNLLTDPFDPRCTEWLVEIPVAVSWADLPGADTIAIEHFSALAQFDFYMQVQRHYTTHNTSATIELREDEIEALGHAIHQAIANDDGYISAALLARFDAPFPRLPFEKIDRGTYDRLHREMLERRRVEDFTSALKRYDRGEMEEAGPAGCDSDKCLLPETPPA